MVGSVTIPKDLTKTLKVTVEDTSAPLLRFITDLLVRVENLERSNKDLLKRVQTLENP